MFVTRALKGAAGALVDAILPPLCLGCGEIVAAPGALCATCWPGYAFISAPHCARCGDPFAEAGFPRTLHPNGSYTLGPFTALPAPADAPAEGRAHVGQLWWDDLGVTSQEPPTAWLSASAECVAWA